MTLVTGIFFRRMFFFLLIILGVQFEDGLWFDVPFFFFFCRAEVIFSTHSKHPTLVNTQRPFRISQDKPFYRHRIPTYRYTVSGYIMNINACVCMCACVCAFVCKRPGVQRPVTTENTYWRTDATAEAIMYNTIEPSVSVCVGGHEGVDWKDTDSRVQWLGRGKEKSI